jgi:pimeloyl-ACP methyl ester carboxylesterase
LNAGIVIAGRRIDAYFRPPSRANAPVLVFLHEGLGSIELWKDVPALLAERTGCGALVYSRYGNGFSDVLEEARPVSYMHDEAREVLPQILDAFDVRDAILIGHSDGASIALIYAGETGTRVRGIVAEAPHVFVEDLSVESIALAKVAFETSDLAQRLARYHKNVERTFYGWNDIWLHPEFRSWNIRDAVRGITVPMLLVQGVDDEYGTLAQLDAIREDASKARIDTLVLADCGHSPHRDRAGMTLDAIAAFISGLSR